MISKKSAVSATRHGLQDATKSNKPRKMSESVCLYRCGEAASAPSPMETQFNGYFFFICFVLPVATTVVQRTPTGEKFPAATRSEHGCSTWAFAHTQLVWVEGLISWPHCSLCQTRDGAVLPSTSAWGLAPVTGTGAAGAAPGVSMLFYSTRQMEKIETHKIIVLWIYNNILLIYYATKIFW